MNNNESKEIQNENQKRPVRRSLRISTIIIWAVFIVVAVLCLILDSHSQRINNEIIRVMAA